MQVPKIDYGWLAFIISRFFLFSFQVYKGIVGHIAIHNHFLCLPNAYKYRIKIKFCISVGIGFVVTSWLGHYKIPSRN
jgi:hypothetical protein